MESAFGLQLKKFIVRALCYALGLVIILALALAIIFSLLKPKLMLLAQAEMRKYGVEAQNMDMSLFGTVHMRNIAMPLPAGGMVRIDEVSARPPLHFLGQTWLGSNGVLYNLRLEKGGVRLAVPELRFSGLAVEDKDQAIVSHSLQMLKRLAVRRLYADKIRLAVVPEAGQNNAAAPERVKLETVIDNFVLSGLARGKIAGLAYDSMESGAVLPASEQKQAAGDKAAAGQNGAAQAANGQNNRQSTVQSGAFLAENLDIAALYALTKNLLPPPAAKNAAALPLPVEARRLVGKIRLHNIAVRAEDEKFGSVHVTAGEFGSNGFALKRPMAPADFITRISPAAGAEAAAAKKQLVLHNLRRILADIAAVNIEMRNVSAEVTPGREALAGIAAAAAAPAAGDDKQKTVREILDEEQAEEPSAGRPALHLPVDFKLSLAAFALTADHWEQLIPYNFYVKVKDLVYRPGPTDSALLSALQETGRQDLQFSLLGDMAWEAADSSLNIRRLAFSGRGIGGFELQGKFLDIPESFFAGKAESVDAILNKAAIANMEIRLQDSGFIHSLVQWGTQEINISAEELQTDLHDIAVKSPPLLLKNSREAQNFSDVFGAFIADSGTIRISMSAPQPEGLKLSDILSAQDDLPALLSRLKLTADRTDSAPLIE
ncbi:MAG: hypothetical protein DU429_05880 [Candidatus Tokpelaia sp.]|nr:MAG: hypothetical protein DU430_07370 [Candidatus Tokpelaia sp.]KAA6206744.1 MAG: hypothetical protein DU429_05880 [Candidatus Tokpelaia sp.]